MENIDWTVLGPVIIGIIDLIAGALPNKLLPYKGLILAILSAIGKGAEKAKES